MAAGARSSLVIRPAGDPAERADALRLRRDVFCGEQGVPEELEVDERDDQALHLVAVNEGGVIGTCRLLVDGSTAKLGRLAVDARWRRRGVGDALVRETEARARARGATRIVLNAQARATGVYAARGFEVAGPRFTEVGIEHVRMEKRLA